MSNRTNLVVRIIFLLCCWCWQCYSVPPAHDRTTSPRNDAMKVMSNAGCSNRVVGLMVIEAYKSHTGILVLMDRLKGVTTLNFNTINNCLLALTAYESLTTTKVKLCQKDAGGGNPSGSICGS